MSMNVAQVEEALLALDRADRAAVIQRGLQSLDADSVPESQAEVDAAWRSELRRRIDDIESGKAHMLSADEVFAEVDARLAKMRR
ncbi:MAG: addiction module protein [Ancrocorticia sp.]